MVYGLRAQSNSARKLADQLKLLSERVPGLIFQFRLNRDGDVSFSYVSDSIREMFGIAPEEAMESADSVYQSIHAED